MRYDALPVAVRGGDLHVGRWTAGPGAPLAVAVHGVTANHRCWLALARTGVADLVAPDLRGRGGSGHLPGPAGMATHAEDLLAVLDRLELDRALLVGHSMGGFVVAAFAEAHPDRVAGVLLVDGGLPLPPPPAGVTPEQALAATIGPAAARLQMTFTDLDDYLAYWRDHPALREAWSPDVEDYLAHDLVGEPPTCRSSVSLDAVRDDSVDLLDAVANDRRAGALPDGTLFLRAPAGLLAEPGGLYPPELAAEHAAGHPAVQVRDVPDVNHYTIVMSEPGAAVLARALEELA
ncbi:MAG TPA: alpha/beta hydrolase [Marmoricola sp.]|nr:alpha/beta hydrolase [Marmoricola sp.]